MPSEFTNAAEAREERLSNGAGFTTNEAHDMTQPDVLGEPRETMQLEFGVGAAAINAARTRYDRHVSIPRQGARRGGRSFPVSSDSELDPEWNVSQQSIRTVEQNTVNARGAALARAVRLFCEETYVKEMNPADRAAAIDRFIQYCSE